MRCATSRASSVKRCVIETRCRSRACQDSSRAATTSETPAAPTAARKTFVRKLVRTGSPGSGLSLGLVGNQFVAELLHRGESIDEQRQLLAQPADVDIHGPGAAGIAVSPDVAEQQIARQDAPAMLQEVAQEHEFLGRQLHLVAVISDSVRREVD